jgi:hypothetical protein
MLYTLHRGTPDLSLGPTLKIEPVNNNYTLLLI